MASSCSGNYAPIRKSWLFQELAPNESWFLLQHKQSRWCHSLRSFQDTPMLQHAAPLPSAMQRENGRTVNGRFLCRICRNATIWGRCAGKNGALGRIPVETSSHPCRKTFREPLNSSHRHGCVAASPQYVHAPLSIDCMSERPGFASPCDAAGRVLRLG